MSGILLAMPILIINMGGEMMYILDQRLRAQEIEESKSKRVLGDVVKTMYNPKFIQELFKPQEMYSNLSTRKIFDRLAHSSIMRLNESSMDKLYDLMTMGVKYQTLSCASPDMVLQVTLNHIYTLKDIAGTQETQVLLDNAVAYLTSTYENMSMGEFFLLKQAIMPFFQGKMVKVSLFLQEGLQNMDGSLIVRPAGTVATGADIPGAVRYFDANGRETRSSDVNLEIAEEAERCPSAPVLERSLDTCPYGVNMYDLTRKRPTADAASIASAKASAPGSPSKSAKAFSKGVAAAELNLLADLIGTPAKEQELKPFKINLFGDDALAKGGGEASVQTIKIDAISDRKTAKGMVGDMGLDSKAQDKKGGDDLLSLMDSA